MTNRAVCLPTTLMTSTTIMILSVLLVGAGCGQAAGFRTAEQLVTALVAQVDTARASTVYDAANDPNRMLGRPSGYSSKASFTDARVESVAFVPDDPGTVERGGSIEIFPSREAAAARRARIQRQAERDPAAAEYDYVAGPVLLRVSRMLTPEQAAEYRSALERLVAS